MVDGGSMKLRLYFGLFFLALAIALATAWFFMPYDLSNTLFSILFLSGLFSALISIGLFYSAWCWRGRGVVKVKVWQQRLEAHEVQLPPFHKFDR